MRIVLLAVVGLFLLMLASGAYIFFVACHRNKNTDWLDAQVVSKTPYAKYYGHIIAADKWLKSTLYQDLYVNARDGVRLHALWVSAAKPKGTIILVHGYRSTYLVDFSMAFAFYHNAGYNMLIIDQRGHGKSGGKFITFGVKESDDLLCWIDFHNRNFGPLPIVLSGLSMGASTVLYVADKNLAHNVRGIIADCGFTSPKAIISAVYKKVTHFPPAMSMWAVNLFAKAFADFSVSQKDTRITLVNSVVPILMIHGKADGFVPCQMSEDGYRVCTGKKKLLLVDGADHGVSFIHDRDAYINAVEDFLKENVDFIQPNST